MVLEYFDNFIIEKDEVIDKIICPACRTISKINAI